MEFLNSAIGGLKEFAALESAVRSRSLPAAVTGVTGIHKANIIYSLCSRLGRRAFVVTSDEPEANRLCSDLEAMGIPAYFYPYRVFTLREAEGVSHEYEHQRLRALAAMLEEAPSVVVCCADAALQLTIPPEELKRRMLTLKVGMQVSMERVLSVLTACGYEAAPQIDGPGQYSRRGGILDFFPTGMSAPVRAEFFGDEIDTLSLFDVETQRRTESQESVTVFPASEAIIGDAGFLAEQIRSIAASLRGKTAAQAKKVLSHEASKLEDGLPLGNADKFLPILYGGKTACVLDYLTDDILLFVSEPVRAKERARSALWQWGEDLKDCLADGSLCRGLDCYNREWTDALSVFAEHGAIYLDAFVHGGYETPVHEALNLTARQLSVWGGNMQLLIEDLRNMLTNKWSCAVLAGNEKAAKNVASDLQRHGIDAVYQENPKKIERGEVVVTTGALSSGFEYPGAFFGLITRGRTAPVKTKRAKKVHTGQEITDISDLTPGDYVVHATHGIGVFEGIHKIEMQGIVKDYIKVRYAKGDTLYVPVTQLDMVSKYIGPREDAAVRLNRIGGTDWQKAKARVRSAVKDIAKDLIKLYAERMALKGHAFPPDTEWQHDFESHFEFEETEDQLRCIEEIKSDMERPVPMDRLLCGDVGFGKTEVALRAAFKCISDGKQCAMLVPTTILAWQHYQTITRRMEGFPVNIQLLSRFRTPKQQEEIIKGLKRGDVDMVVGTHRLISQDVEFRDLGLIIIDEEQRFGVAQKEKLKTKYKTVDVLTLSATPIPRTLNMALSGIRDMSIIEEAPRDRHPVQTYVLEHDDNIIYEAIRRELRRGGQVYYLHNDVATIERTAARIQAAIPEAKVGFGHGKMSEQELSEVWRRLIEQEIDVLVCTTIIETGVDVPNVNTLIIENADRMGLSQLHQIRGRVGRSNRRAYAYLTFRRNKVLSEAAQKRLTAIRQFTEFGSGFKIAMRDMEIRGAGNILGGEQHGHMEAVGYDMYLHLLSDAIRREKGEEVQEYGEECLVDLQVPAHIPEDYIPDLNQRLDIYRRIADIRTSEDALDVTDELIDRFGEPPASVNGLVQIALLRNRASALGIKEIKQQGDKLLLYRDSFDMKKISALIAAMRGRVMVNAGTKPYISVTVPKGQEPVAVLEKTLSILGGDFDEKSQKE
ncbi:transcription-repair coupling factor [Thermocaproicibacter melissae]|uniref:transcription-repair coupling factor n=1 Tax=Thermocaproicibacter melissae TaxID=2966552 RepID=UPI0024B21884|nr:transcription-repair coupling factor [Thermocaproicibacter melissae]WBY63898.1 transcription-repair coupling factor [Thermocaproicibacter melissae]